ncbi:hypothetical protein PC118_g14403 [Phytophthora cactorum]|uniref:Uncharacterized protein n=1 Tax=Phytophthora cactorum TaxID=29920 RepID=A0A8T1FPF7_9STRA|nr:hypothetical protein PC112_g19144 [Phytophthora cactorum]KAG2824618.1 hypothetical protein PC111_g9743 [Phytophthora cactorum]KAG2974661.1 hypothetical protein PC118_g14403 [Phytophthora cactorum]KAG3005479.1 hypothetical protein PC119_g15294 [Phytophthora cactorum]
MALSADSKNFSIDDREEKRQALPVRPPPSYRLPCLSRPTTQRLQSRPIPGRLAAATTEKTCILGEKFLMSPQSELTISNS